MSINNTYEYIKKIISEQLDINEIKIKIDSSIVNDLNIDSLDLVELIMSLEEQFEIEISDEDSQKFLTINDIINYVNLKINNKKVI